MKLKIHLYLILFFLGISRLSAETGICNLYEVTINQKVNESNFIFEGKVLSKSCFWNSEKNLIYTSSKIEVYKLFKGSYLKSEFILNTEGGSLDGQFHRVSPSLELNVGDAGIFFANGTSVSNPELDKNFIQLQAYGGVHGFVQYDLFDQSASAPFSKYVSVFINLYPELTSLTGKSFSELKPFQWSDAHTMKTSAAPVISSFSPTIVSAGTSTILTINGSGFGNSMNGSAAVMFKNSNDGGNSYISAFSSQVVYWSDNVIQVKVPHKAGTGNIRVVDASNNGVVSSGTLTVTYNLINLDQNGNAFRPILADVSSGGYTFSYSSSFFNDNAAYLSFQKGLDKWRCGTYVNFNSGNINNGVNCAVQDGISIVSYDDAGGCALPVGYLGQTLAYYGGCINGPDFYISPNEIDFKFSKNPSGGWNMTSSATSGGKYDFLSNIIHELGHGHQLDHVIGMGKVMHFALLKDSDVRNLDVSSDVAAGNDVITKSTITNPCGPNPMTKLTTFNCATITVGIEEKKTNEMVKVSPVPTSGKVEFQLSNELKPQNILIYNGVGEIVFNKDLNSLNFELNLENLDNGIYLYRINSLSGEISKGKILLIR